MIRYAKEGRLRSIEVKGTKNRDTVIASVSFSRSEVSFGASVSSSNECPLFMSASFLFFSFFLSFFEQKASK